MPTFPNGDSLLSPRPAAPASAPTRRSSITAKPSTSAIDIRHATTPAEVRAALAALHEREAAITTRLDSLLSSQVDLGRDLARLDILRASLGSQVIATRAISADMLSGASDTAGRLSDKVKELDLEKSRVEDTLGVVEQVAELKACINGVVGSMGAPQDWEAAAGYIARVSKVPEDIVRGRFAAGIVPSVEVPDQPWVTLENAKESLCSLFLREFEKATSEGDNAKVTRFFKLFPLIGRGDVGLDVYGRYVCQGVASSARATLKTAPAGRKDGYFYANALTKLFEHIAQIVEGHGSLVERHYGEGKMVKVVERLQMEADVQGGIILDSWSDERNVERRMTDVKSYPFSFLVQSFLPQQRVTGTARVNSPALGGGSTNVRNSEDEGVDMKEVDAILNEISVMLSRWSLFTRFISGKCKVASKLMSPYNAMSLFFFRRSVEKAFQLDEYPSGLSLSLTKPIEASPPYIILAVDDVVFIVNAVIQKSLATSQREVISSVVSTIGRVMSVDFIGMVQRKMRDESYPVRSLDMANEYLERIIQVNLGVSSEQPNGVAPSSAIRDAFPNDRDAGLVAATLSTLLVAFTSKTTELLNEGLQVLFHNVVKLRLRPVISDTFRDIDYSLTEEETAEAAQLLDEDEASFHDLVAGRFERGWDQLMRPISRLLTAKTYATLLDTTARNLSRQLEKRLWGYAGRTSAFGAVRMERDFSGVVSAVAKGNYATREVFARVTQMLMVVNMEDDEWEEVVRSSDAAARGAGVGDEEDNEDGILWVLTEEERTRARALVR
ncbi:unnamed protein product [Parascedosporium putredinis]|uniref:Conserved oligomeric Golgi complex subunit 4 n=1 Tax=Parascedosporium putredinis TaxID=1442378 RepID=A0A9P1H5W9_9PEZI|nr:unnamed protein product [Parascedosporium putredinis]CAI7998319.1 unnamed protein product [Parascedosporium putredinis]